MKVFFIYIGKESCSALYEQCGGIHWKGAKQCCTGSTCSFQNNYYSQCLPSSEGSETSDSCVALYAQCGGRDWKGSTQCCSGSRCVFNNDYYSQCLPSFEGSGTSDSCIALYAQCGGGDWKGSTQCCSGSKCVFNNNYYSQCLPSSGGTGSSDNTPKTTKQTPSNTDRKNGETTRYWDCCKPSCGWPGKAYVTNQVKTCARNGFTQINADTQSGCNGGNAYGCNNQQPWNVSLTLSYGFAAANIGGQKESDWCCACYSLIFISGPVTGKELIVQVTNTGGDLGNNHFDIQMPGGGVGLFDGCSKQFPEVSKSAWGQQYGGVNRRSDCNNLPSVLRSGCFWRFDWFQNADNPKITFKKVSCPKALTKQTGCVRK